MDNFLKIRIAKQPDDTTCGPTSLHAVYNYYNDPISLEQVIKEIDQFEDGGGTLAVVLGRHALERGYDVHLYSYNINIFDPTWFDLPMEEIKDLLMLRLDLRRKRVRERIALQEYINFIESGGKMYFEDLSKQLLVRYLKKGIPILTGLSSTWLYQDSRENSVTNVDDDVNGDPAGHFVIISGLKNSGTAFIADPYHMNPIDKSCYYEININRLINSILLGTSTYDGNLLIIQKRDV